MLLPIFLSMPLFVVGMPVAFVNDRFKRVMPKALFNEKLKPGIFVFVITVLFKSENSLLYISVCPRCKCSHIIIKKMSPILL